MTDQFDDFCKDTTDLLPTKFRPPSEKLWIYLTPTKHGLLHHSCELIESNEGRGMLTY